MNHTADDEFAKRLHTQALTKLCIESGSYPECMELKGVRRMGQPVARGNYGAVWKGIQQGRFVAVKVLHVWEDFRQPDEQQLLRVSALLAMR